MYKVYAKNGDDILCIHNDVSTSKDDKLSNPKLTLTENAAGQFDAKVPSTNVGYDHLERVYTEIIVERQGTEIWSGRIISVKEDFYKNKTITCEGEMAYLNDTIQPQEPYENTDTNTVLDSLLQIHNQKVDERKQITLGYTTINGDISSSYTNYNSTLEAINDLVIKPFGGIIEVKRNNNGQLKLNYFSEDDRSPSSQTINFGENLLDFTKSYDSTDFCTVVLPLGARIQDKYGISTSGIDGVEAYVTIEEVNDGSPYLANLDTLETYGRIEKTIQYSEIEDPEELMAAAALYLTSQQFDKMVIEINAVDLGYLNVNAGNINLSENVRVISKPHGLDRFFPVTKISIPLDNPANTTFTMGGTVTSLTTKGVSGIGGLSDLIEKIPTKSDILDAAKRRADDLINAFTTGYITITTDKNGSNELFVTDTQITTKEDVFEHCNRYWRWNLNGLGYYNKNKAKYSNPNGLVMAMTMDGEICADFITTGVLNAEIIKAGILQGYNNHDNWWNLLTGEFHIGLSAKYGDDPDQTIETRFAVTDGLISSEVNRATGAEETLGSSIVQTATAISSSVYVDGKFYDPGSYTISVSGVGNPNGQVDASSYTYRYYMDVTNGYIYRSNGSTWNYVTTATSKSNSIVSNILQTATAISSEVSRATDAESNISSKILQTATAISSSVSASGKWYDPGSYTISVSGVGNPDGQYSPGSYYYQYYMDITNGYIYYSNGYSWSYVARATQQTGSMTSTIKQTASEVSLKISKGDEFRTELSANADSIRMVSSKILISADNLTVTEDGTLTCNNAVIHGTVEVGGYENNYGSLKIKDYNDNNSMIMDYHGIYDSDWNFSLTKTGISFSNGDYWNPRGAGMNSDGTVSLYELDIRDGNGVYVFKENDFRQGLTGTIQVYTYVGHGNTRRQRYFHFKNGILYSIDETYDDGFTQLID